MPVIMEKRIVFEPRDVVKIRIQCGLCGGEFSPPTVRALAEDCPLCGKSWKFDLPSHHQHRDGYDEELRRLVNLIGEINYFSGKGDYGKRRAEGKVPWRILLELPGDPD